MLIVHVDVTVFPERVGDFIAAISLNAQASRLEIGVLRFDVVQDAHDPAHFVLVEVYRDDRAAAAHKDTQHYTVWRDTVAEMMALAAHVPAFCGGVAVGRTGLDQRTMTVAFEFAATGRVVFGAGRSAQLPQLVAGWGSRTMVCTGSRPEALGELIDRLPAANLGGRSSASRPLRRHGPPSTRPERTVPTT